MSKSYVPPHWRVMVGLDTVGGSQNLTIAWGHWS